MDSEFRKSLDSGGVNYEACLPLGILSQVNEMKLAPASEAVSRRNTPRIVEEIRAGKNIIYKTVNNKASPEQVETTNSVLFGSLGLFGLFGPFRS